MAITIDGKFPFIHQSRAVKIGTAEGRYIHLITEEGTEAGMDVNSRTALNLAAVWRAINLISSTLASLPVHVYKKAGQNRREVNTVGGQAFGDPTLASSQMVLREALQASVLIHGNGYGYITRSRQYEPLGIDFIPHDNVQVRTTGGRIFYRVKFDDGERDVRPERILHIPGLSFDGLVGMGVIDVARASLGGGLAMQKYGNRFFKNGAKQSGILSYPYQISDRGRDNLRAKFEEKMKGDQGGTMILEEGTKYQTITIPNDQAQFLESRKFTVTEIARWFGLPPYMLGDLDTTGKNSIEQQSIEFIQYSLMPWVRRWEQELNRKLLTEEEKEKHYFKFNLNGLMRGDNRSRAEYYRLMLDMGVLSINEVRQLEEFNNIKGGDQHLVQLARTTLDKVGQDEGNQT